MKVTLLDDVPFSDNHLIPTIRHPGDVMYSEDLVGDEVNVRVDVAFGEDAELAAGGGVMPDCAGELVFGGEVHEGRQGAKGAT